MTLRVTDCQVHIIPRHTATRPWTHQTGRFHGTEEFGVDTLIAEMDQAGVERAIVVPTFAVDGHRNDAVLAAAHAHPDRLAAVGRIDLMDPGQASLATGWRDVPGLLGFRVTFQAGESAKWLDDGTADWFWPLAEASEVPLYIHVPDLLSRVPPLLERHPHLKLAIDHVGIPGTARPDEVPSIVEKTIELARFPNVSVKISGMPCVAGDAYPFTSVHGEIRDVIEAFGVQRVFWGSDLTRLPCTYRESVTMYTEALQLSDVELEWVMGRALRTWLNWE